MNTTVLPRRFAGSLAAGFALIAATWPSPGVAQTPATSQYYFGTLAGDATYGSANGPGDVAKFNQPDGVGTDANGNVYVADTLNHTIRKISAAGLVTTFAGSSGVADYVEGNGAAARFRSPGAVASDAAGNIYVADTGNGVLRKITPSGDVSTLGTGIGLGSPHGVAVDANGNIYVADTESHAIRKISAGGVVTILAGSPGNGGNVDGAGAAARFASPYGVAVDLSGTVYVADTGNGAIRKISPAGLVTTLATRIGEVILVANTVTYLGPQGVAVDRNGDLYVANTYRNAVIKVSAAGVVSDFAGGKSTGSLDGVGMAAELWHPASVAIDAAGNLVVADTRNNRIRKITLTAVVTTVAGSGRAYVTLDGLGSSAAFYSPYGVARDDQGNIFVTEIGGNSVRKISLAGMVTTFAGLNGTSGYVDATGAAARFSSPSDVAVDRVGNKYVSDSGNNTIRKITPDGRVTTLAGKPGLDGLDSSGDGVGAAARFHSPNGIAVDDHGVVFVADYYHHAVRRISPDGVVTTFAGKWDEPAHADGPGALARFRYPSTLAIDRSGNLYVGDEGNHLLRKISRDGIVSTLAGTATTAVQSDLDGAGPAARFANIGGIVVDASGTIFLTDRSAATIRKCTPDGVVTTIAGLSGSSGNADGAGAAARFTYPLRLAVDERGVLYVSDPGTGTIRIGFPVTSTSTLANLSSRGQIGAGDKVLIAGFIVAGSGPKTLLIRGAGPALTSFGVVGALARPQLTLVQNGSVLASNQGWQAAANASEISTAAAAVGAFGFLAGSNDSAILTTLGAGSYSAIETGVSGSTGIGLVEVYDVDASGAPRRLRNFSARGQVGVGGDVLIAGLGVLGSAPMKIMLRVVGPGLGAYGVSGAVTDPQLEVYRDSDVVAQNSGWKDDALVRAAGQAVGAFPLANGSKDAAIIVTLPPGNYTVLVRSQSGVAGIGLVEAYEIPWE
ncbi:MAG: repeat containing protein [Verrucomicrobia bacterium]|nr:repeat containing protein [Verrucomicrobiota bacterium]